MDLLLQGQCRTGQLLGLCLESARHVLPESLASSFRIWSFLRRSWEGRSSLELLPSDAWRHIHSVVQTSWYWSQMEITETQQAQFQCLHFQKKKKSPSVFLLTGYVGTHAKSRTTTFTCLTCLKFYSTVYHSHMPCCQTTLFFWRLLVKLCHWWWHMSAGTIWVSVFSFSF